MDGHCKRTDIANERTLRTDGPCERADTANGRTLALRPFLVSVRSQFPSVRSVRKLRREVNPPNTRVGMIWGRLEKDLFEVTIQNYCSMQLGVSATLFLLRASSLSDMQRKAMFLSCYSYLLYIAMRKEQSTSLMR